MPTAAESTLYRPMLFISHRETDRAAATAVAERLSIISSRLKIYLSSDPNFEGPRVGRSINSSLREALGSTSLVLLIFSAKGEDWSWCMWECGVATDPNDKTPTNVATLSLRGDAPKPYEDTLMVKASDLDSVQTFVNELCTRDDFFPDFEGPLTNRPPNDGFIQEQARLLYEELEEYTEHQDWKPMPRWGGFTISIDKTCAQNLDELAEPPVGDQALEIATACRVSHQVEWGPLHFGYTSLRPDMTLLHLWERWRDSPSAGRSNGQPWIEILVEELWRIVQSRPTRIIGTPFLSMIEGESDFWAYPIVYKYRLHSGGSVEFDLLVVRTWRPRSD